MKRQIIEIDAAQCNGCGQCVPNCPEGALQIIDGKARLISDIFCDGLGACMGNCPEGAIKTVVREAGEYDEKKVMAKIIPQGTNTITAHLQHLLDHGEKKLYHQALEALKEADVPIPHVPAGGNCCSSMAETNVTDQKPQWPLQLKLINPAAADFNNAHLLIAADCSAFAFADFHTRLAPGRKIIIFCPKLDSEITSYVEKLAEIFSHHAIASVTVARMSVPCCGGTVAIVQKAMTLAGINTDLKVKIININGELPENQ